MNNNFLNNFIRGNPNTTTGQSTPRTENSDQDSDLGSNNNLIMNEDMEDEDQDPDTDNEQHARSQLLRTKARTSSVSNEGIYPNYKGAISALPPEMLCLIFSYIHSKSDLLSIALTCKYWGNLIIELVWFRPGIGNKHVFEKLGKIMKMDPSKTAWNYRKYIKRLNLSLVPSLVNDQYLELFYGATNLERITLVNCTKVTGKSISKLLQGCSRLQSIDLTGVRDIQDEIYIELASNCKRLQGLYAPGSFNVSQNAVMNLISSCPLLKRVKLSDCNSVIDDVVNGLVRNCPNLVELDLHGCETVTNESLRNLFLNLEFLKEFKISKNQNINYKCFESNTGSILCLDKLRILDFTQCSNITDKAVQKFIQLAPKLRNVVLSKCSAITDASLKAIATLGKNLHYVHLGHCSNITDYGARELIKSCYRLQYIDLACCTQLTNATVVELSQLSKLRRIGLVKCSQITDDGILALAENSRNSEDSLERVHLSYCVHLTIYPIYRLLKSCPKLTHISLTGISQFLRPDITQFCREPPQEFNPHQKSIFCVFSGEGVNQLRNHLTHLIETTEDQDREVTEIMQIITGIIESSTPISMEQINENPNQRERLRVFLNTTEALLSDYEGLTVDRATLENFARCIFGGVLATQLTRVQRFFQLMNMRPVQQRERQRQLRIQLIQQAQAEQVQAQEQAQVQAETQAQLVQQQAQQQSMQQPNVTTGQLQPQERVGTDPSNLQQQRNFIRQHILQQFFGNRQTPTRQQADQVWRAINNAQAAQGIDVGNTGRGVVPPEVELFQNERANAMQGDNMNVDDDDDDDDDDIDELL